MEANKTLALSLTQNTPLIATAWSATAVGGLSYSRAPKNSTHKINIQWYMRGGKKSEECNYFYTLVLQAYCLKLKFATILYVLRCCVGELCQQQNRCKKSQMTGKCDHFPDAVMQVVLQAAIFCIYYFEAAMLCEQIHCNVHVEEIHMYYKGHWCIKVRHSLVLICPVVSLCACKKRVVSLHTVVTRFSGFMRLLSGS